MDRLSQISGQIAGKSSAGGRDAILQKNPDDVRPSAPRTSPPILSQLTTPVGRRDCRLQDGPH